jgi:hypothetical protein
MLKVFARNGSTARQLDYSIDEDFVELSVYS